MPASSRAGFFDQSSFHRALTAGLSVHVFSEIHFVEREGIKFETNRLHLSRQDELVMWAALTCISYQIFHPTFFSRVGLDVLILHVLFYAWHTAPRSGSHVKKGV